MSAALHLQNFELGYNTPTGVRYVMEDVNVNVPGGQFLLLVGPSGSGKSSLLSAVLGLGDPFSPAQYQAGTLEVLGHRVEGTLPHALRNQVTAVFQGGALIDELSPIDNVQLAVREAGLTPERAKEFLERVQLPHPPSTVSALSGGEQKRLALARALAADPKLWILDEPTAGLDPQSAQHIASLIRTLHDESEGRTTIVITHDLDVFEPHIDGALLLDRTRGSLQYLDKENWREAIESAEHRASFSSAPPPVVDAPFATRASRSWVAFLLSLGVLANTLWLSLRHLIPRHIGMLARAFMQHLVLPAPFIACACFAGGAIATYFALQNNPLERGFQHEVLVGSGKVLVGTALPLLAGILFAARISAGAAARIGGYRRARVYEALPLIGVHPAAFLLNPLLLSAIVSAVLLTALGIVFGCVASLLAAHATTGISAFAWAAAAFDAVDARDLRWALVKAVVAGLITAWVPYVIANRPMHSAQDVAHAANSSIVWSTLTVLAAQGVLTAVEYG